MAILSFFSFKKLGTIGYTGKENLVRINSKIIKNKDVSRIQDLKYNSLQILQKMPINDEALLQLSLADNLSSPSENYQLIIQEAKKRNPKRRATILARINEAYSEKNIPTLLKEASALYRLEPKYRDDIVKLLSSSYGELNGDDFINEYIKNNELWSYRLLYEKINELNENNVDKLQKSLFIFLENSKNRDAKDKILLRFLMRLIQMNQHDKAFQLWKKTNTHQSSESKEHSLLFNPQLKDSEAPSPFNWSLNNSDFISTEYDPPGGVYVYYSGKKPELILRQYFPWSHKGLMKAKIQSIENNTVKSAIYFIEIRCAKDHQLISTLDIKPHIETQSIENGLHELYVKPNTCEYAYFDLKARPGRFSGASSIIFNHIDILTNQTQ